MAERHGGTAPPPTVPFDPDAPAPTDQEAMATLMAAFPGAVVDQDVAGDNLIRDRSAKQ